MVQTSPAGVRSDAPTPENNPPEAAPATFSIKSVSKVFATKTQRTEALQDINLDISEGETVSLIGRSGCGKSTLLRIMAGLLPPTEGNVYVSGKPLWKGHAVESGVLEQLGVVFQEPHLFPWFDITDNIALPLKLRGVGKAERRRRATELADLVGLGDFLKSYPRELSGGMRQRVAIARALSRDPELLLMDEPFGALDALTREKMNLELQRITLATEATVVFVTHDISEAVFIGDRVVQLTPRPGRIQSIVEVGLDRPRPLDVQATEAFGSTVRDLRHALESEES
ncbi:ABC transporter ATP-binding protein [Citricoccus zhacaiensis]|uniref:ABC transporter ATP-binding protein n=1 Tax=Citricoccus zhacaiensis TaxID=489142 RepID=A0ABQ2LWX3_9MICC|nr:ABC transporter ATP-binding protein [Citricoccus zhacaiensis]GGO44107.1 ABC transporter ATP-binding protein [Citricoccus zhacaiensis]